MTVLFNTRRVSNSAARDYIRGAGTIFNIRGKTMREYNLAPSPAAADAAATSNDWSAIYSDYEGAVECYRKNAR